jgi:hypothetical protein
LGSPDHSRTEARRLLAHSGHLRRAHLRLHAPSPLYRLYQQKWHFSATTVTAVFGVYALVLLLALLVFGSYPTMSGGAR